MPLLQRLRLTPVNKKKRLGTAPVFTKRQEIQARMSEDCPPAYSSIYDHLYAPRRLSGAYVGARTAHKPSDNSSTEITGPRFSSP